MKKRDKHDSIVKIKPDKHPKLYKVLKWLENQWYHNKAAILCVAFFSFVIIFGFSQCLAKKAPDYKILLCLDNYLPSEVRAAMEIYTAQYGEDLNGDGEVLVHILDCTNGTDRDQNYANMTTLLSELQLGEAVLIIADEHYYQSLTQDGDIFDTDPLFNAKEGKAYALKGSDFSNFINLTYDGYMTDDIMIYKRIMNGTDSGEGKKAQQSKVDSEAWLKKFIEAQEAARQ